MRQLKFVLFLLTVSLIAFAQDAAPAHPLTQAQPKPLQQQVADLNQLTANQQAQIKSLQEDLRVQMQKDTAATLQVKSAVRKESLMQGAGLGAGAMLLVVAIMFGARKQPQSNPTTKPQARAATA
jgi:Spy/CpxP family protein refolding chaperone